MSATEERAPAGAPSRPAAAPACPACRGPLTQDLGTKNSYRLAGCPACGTVSVVPLPNPAELTQYYKSYRTTPKYLGKREAKLRQARRRIGRLGSGFAGKRFLDVGCSAGFAVAAACQTGMDAHGIDIDPDSVSLAQSTFGRALFETASIQDYADKGGRADILYTSEVIEHTPEPENFAEAAARILVPGGRLLLTTPDAGHWRRPRHFTDWIEANPPLHLILYSKEGLRRLLGRHGFGAFRFEFKLKPRITLHARRAG